VGFEGVIVGVVEVLTDVMEEDTDPGLTDVDCRGPLWVFAIGLSAAFCSLHVRWVLCFDECVKCCSLVQVH
jgi:hypothetical protein